MKKFSLLFLLSIFFNQLKAQEDQQKLKEIIVQAYESVSPATRQWFIEVARQHPAGDFDTAYAKRKLQEKFTPSQLVSTGDLFMVMLAFQKMQDKEARGDQKLQAYQKKRMLASKEEKIKLDNQRIDQEMKEAAEKSDRAMSAAVTQLITSAVSASIQISAASMYSHGKQNVSGKDSAKPKRKITPVNQFDKSQGKLPVTLYIKKLEGQLLLLKKEKNQ